MNLNNIPRKLFGTSGIRGPIGKAVTADLALKLGKAISTKLGPGHSIVVGYDTELPVSC